MSVQCETCQDTGWYGDNGPGIKGNSEYQPCDQCQKGYNIENSERLQQRSLRAENERLRQKLDKTLDTSHLRYLDLEAENERLRNRWEKLKQSINEWCESIYFDDETEHSPRYATLCSVIEEMQQHEAQDGGENDTQLIY